MSNTHQVDRPRAPEPSTASARSAAAVRPTAPIVAAFTAVGRAVRCASMSIPSVRSSVIHSSSQSWPRVAFFAFAGLASSHPRVSQLRICSAEGSARGLAARHSRSYRCRRVVVAGPLRRDRPARSMRPGACDPGVCVRGRDRLPLVDDAISRSGPEGMGAADDARRSRSTEQGYRRYSSPTTAGEWPTAPLIG